MYMLCKWCRLKQLRKSYEVLNGEQYYQAWARFDCPQGRQSLTASNSKSKHQDAKTKRKCHEWSICQISNVRQLISAENLCTVLERILRYLVRKSVEQFKGFSNHTEWQCYVTCNHGGGRGLASLCCNMNSGGSHNYSGLELWMCAVYESVVYTGAVCLLQQRQKQDSFVVQKLQLQL